MSRRILSLLFLLCLPALAVCAANPSYTPLPDLGDGLYQGYQGGLYPGGRNVLPAGHLAVGKVRAGMIQPRNGTGQLDPDGRIVLLSIGMSNTTMEFSTFKQVADADPQKNPRLVVVDGAQGSQDAEKIKEPTHSFWNVVDQRLGKAGVTGRQVQAVWLKEAIAGEKRGFPADAQALRDDLRTIVLILHQRFPNLQVVYLASRTYGGYAKTNLNPEPHAYESGFAVKWLIEEQINGVEGLSADPAKGAAKSPWLAWGPYLWTNGARGRRDGLVWEAEDVREDGTHPSRNGCVKIARLLLDFFKTDELARRWFLRE